LLITAATLGFGGDDSLQAVIKKR